MIRESYKDSRNMPPPYPVNNEPSLREASLFMAGAEFLEIF